MALAVCFAGIAGISSINEVRSEEAFTPICENREAVIAGLASQYSEKPVSMGYTAQGTILEILASPDGSWTMIESSSDGTTCLVANGDAWRDMNNSVKTSAISDTML